MKKIVLFLFGSLLAINIIAQQTEPTSTIALSGTISQIHSQTKQIISYKSVSYTAGEFVFWDIATGGSTKTIAVSNLSMTCFVLSPDGKIIAVGSENKKVILLDAGTGNTIRELTGSSAAIKGLDFSRDGKILCSYAGWDKNIRLWNVADGQAIKQIQEKDQPINVLAFTPNNKRFVSGSASVNSLKVWDCESGTITRSIGLKLSPKLVAFGNDNNICAMVCVNDKNIQIWNLETGSNVKSFAGQAIGIATAGISSLAFSTDGSALAYGADNNTIRILSVADGSEMVSFKVSSWGTVESIVFSADGKSIVSIHSDKKARVWDISKQKFKAVAGSGGGGADKEKIKQYVEKRINEWQQKGKYEKTADYQKRVNEQSRKQYIDKYTQEAIDTFALAGIDWTGVTNEYDADNEAFKMNFDRYGAIFIKVPVAEAESFDQNFKSMQFLKPKFTLAGKNFALLHLEIKNPVNRKTYIYDSKEAVEFSSSQLVLNFDPIEVNIQENQQVNNNQQKQQNTKTVIVGKADVDVNIPQMSGENSNTYALIIGNEEYSKYQTGLGTEVNVDFAINDAEVFKEYCVKTLGIPEKQVKLLVNGTAGQMKQGLSWINNLAKIEGGNANLIFYYSGHGLPDESTKEPYLIPVDVAASDITYAVKLSDVYGKLTEFPSQRITVFLDACFSGGARNQGLVAVKGMKIKSKSEMVEGNMVVFASSSGEESSAVYREKQHGYFTYFLLKKLQETKGDVTYDDLSTYLVLKVAKETGLISKKQTPNVSVSTSIQETWKEWKMK